MPDPEWGFRASGRLDRAGWTQAGRRPDSESSPLSPKCPVYSWGLLSGIAS